MKANNCLNCGTEVSHNDSSFCTQCKKPQKSQTKSKLLPFAPFIAVKIETSGLPDRGEADILEVAMIYGDYGTTNPDNRPRINFYIKNPKIRWQKEAKEKVGHLEERIKNKELPVYTLEEAKVELNKFYNKCIGMSGEWKNLLVGRNMYSLIIPMLKQHGLYNEELIDHAALDLSSLFYFKMGGRSTTKEIMKRYDVPLPDNSAATEAVSILSVMYEEVGIMTKQSTMNWY